MSRGLARVITLGANLALPLEITTESTAIVGIRRSGKSHTAKKAAEELHAAGQQIVVLDPKGDWWGLRSAADGKAPGIPIIIMGGEHGDRPLTVTAGEQVARLVVEQRASIVLDLSAFRKGEIHRFATDFLETLYRLKSQEQYRTPLALIVDEADVIAPQAPRQQGQKGGYVERMLGAIDDCVRRGGQRGIGVILVTQRPAVLNKNVLSQCGILMLLRLTGKNDIEAIQGWIAHHSQEEQADKVMASIAALPRGDVWVWAPGWPDERGTFARIHVGPCWTFDSGKTPEIGRAHVAPKMLADVDLAAFDAEMAATIEKAEADDPKRLHARIRELEQAAARPAAALPPAPEPQVEYVDRPVLEPADLELMRAVLGDLSAAIDRIEHERESLSREAEATRETMGRLQAGIDKWYQQPPAPKAVTRKPAMVDLRIGGKHVPIKSPYREGLMEAYGDPLPKLVDGRNGQGRDLPIMQRAFLVLLADRRAAMTRKQLMVLAGYQSGGATSRAFTALLREGLITGVGLVELTPAGRAALGDYTPLPTGDKLRDHLLYKSEKLPLMERRMLERACEAYPKSLSRSLVIDELGYSSGGATSRAFTALIAKGYLEKAGVSGVAATDLLFG